MIAIMILTANFTNVATMNKSAKITFLRGPRSAFRFACAACGRCCGEFRIILSPYDIIRLANATGCSSRELIRRGTIKVTYESFRNVFGFAPVARLFDCFPITRRDIVPIAALHFRKNSSGKRECEFLLPPRNGHRLCGIYQDRPAMCRLYPLGFTTVAGNRKWFFREPLCKPTKTAEQTVEAWIRRSELGPFLHANARYLKWMRLILEQYDDFGAITKNQLKSLSGVLYDYDSVAPQRKITIHRIEEGLREWLSSLGNLER